MAQEDNGIERRLRRLEEHLKEENPLLLDVVGSFRVLDTVSRRIGFLDRSSSYATRVPWWPLISVLGIYSSGKSTFINRYLEHELQTTGSQAVDDKFTVICYGTEPAARVLPGIAVDADPRLPLYQMSGAIEEVAAGEGRRIDAYVQLKTCPSAKLRGKILIDSPGFDADAQRSATLRITRHMIDLSDLVLVFFDARHPEAGSMKETLEHLVRETIHRHDSNKFLFVLNQIDNAAREDNPEQVFAAWQRALSQSGLTAGRCYCVYDPVSAIQIEDAALRARFEGKRDADMKEIFGRIEQVGVERSYRIVSMLHHTAHSLETEVIPRVQKFLEVWRMRVLWTDAVVLGGLVLGFLLLTLSGGYWDGLHLRIPLLGDLGENATVRGVLGFAALGALGYLHHRVRGWCARLAGRKVLKDVTDRDLVVQYERMFDKNTRWWRSLFAREPAGWGARSRKQVAQVTEQADAYVQRLNDIYTAPAGQDATQRSVTTGSAWEAGQGGLTGLEGFNTPTKGPFAGDPAKER